MCEVVVAVGAVKWVEVIFLHQATTTTTTATTTCFGTEGKSRFNPCGGKIRKFSIFLGGLLDEGVG